MRRFWKFTAVMMVCASLASPQIMAQRQGNERHENTSRPSANNHNNSNNKPNRPGQNNGHGNRPGQNNGQGNRPGQNNGQGNRPGQNNGQGNRPGQNNGQGNRPGQNNGQGNRPGQNHGQGNHEFRPNQPGTSNYPNFGTPTRPGHFTPPPAPPVRPYRPSRPGGWNAWHRPTPPATWRPIAGVPSIGSILGMAFGTALANSIDFLTSAGYAVDGYQNGVVYLRNVPQLNFYWPDAMLYYDNGRLSGSEYVYSTTYYDQARYNTAYNSLIYNYGQPVSITYPSAGNVLATWFVPGNGFITLQYGPVSVSGGIRYYTTLQVGRY